ncbi:hypothetical protein BABINDRAFT_159572 [Babjeviella inositovora NRRL Y-12698]|uniref:C2H2-type domain-containing protein n=1 Tax=Babjeviella inositovora NRRL Y-12698 TaxID=984486 RepID=A0A1E3R151_9ASCO|nr:uncharacterized protein BABINDRAFT_159572 [Babjeviella inositovora NRRL Y-12698]ODQ83117.1 hypothetical protein BABINDRAFT_159572 [Babjeviella inositovora NRRL Y-12698]
MATSTYLSPHEAGINMTDALSKKAAKPRVFQCTGYDGCNMTFTRSEHLARHVRKHTGERPYNCTFCGRNFSRLDNLRQHKQTVHANVHESPPQEHAAIHTYPGLPQSNSDPEIASYRDPHKRKYHEGYPVEYGYAEQVRYVHQQYLRGSNPTTPINETYGYSGYDAHNMISPPNSISPANPNMPPYGNAPPPPMNPKFLKPPSSFRSNLELRRPRPVPLPSSLSNPSSASNASFGHPASATEAHHHTYGHYNPPLSAGYHMPADSPLLPLFHTNSYPRGSALYQQQLTTPISATFSHFNPTSPYAANFPQQSNLVTSSFDSYSQSHTHPLYSRQSAPKYPSSSPVVQAKPAVQMPSSGSDKTSTVFLLNEEKPLSVTNLLSEKPESQASCQYGYQQFQETEAKEIEEKKSRGYANILGKAEEKPDDCKIKLPSIKSLGL